LFPQFIADELYTLSDTFLYEKAESFISDLRSQDIRFPKDSQIMGLWNVYTSSPDSSYKEAKNYIDHQINREKDLEFYKLLKKMMNDTFSHNSDNDTFGKIHHEKIEKWLIEESEGQELTERHKRRILNTMREEFEDHAVGDFLQHLIVNLKYYGERR